MITTLQTLEASLVKGIVNISTIGIKNNESNVCPLNSNFKNVSITTQ